MKYTLTFTATALKSLKAIDTRYKKRMMGKIELLAENPLEMSNVKKLVDYDVSYSMRVGDYRVLFERDDSIKIIDIIDIRHRRESYRRS
ncbi:MAG: hypothetical protein EPN82_13755 [Bacteroidetes bacterium]|nr:MAG: hypothetical protein EPN82_13755 [Bacteroidota bacterium]